MFKKNEQVARIQWFNLVLTDDWGNRYYFLDVISVNSFIRVRTRKEFKLKRVANSRYVITSDEHASIMRYSDENEYEVEEHEIKRSSK